jgi:cytochrome subunit of sulfide dehydrogenase
MMVPQSTSAALFDPRRGHVTARYHRDAHPSSTQQIIALSIAASLVTLVADRGAAADDDRGSQLAATCASCHHLDGRDRGIPSIVGLSEQNFVEVMRAFKSGERSSQIMHAVSLSLTDEEIAILARYLAAQGKETQQP